MEFAQLIVCVTQHQVTHKLGQLVLRVSYLHVLIICVPFNMFSVMSGQGLPGFNPVLISGATPRYALQAYVQQETNTIQKSST